MRPRANGIPGGVLLVAALALSGRGAVGEAPAGLSEIRFVFVKTPRDEILRYAFVLCPLAEVAGDTLHPVERRSYRDLWANFEHRSQPMQRVQPDFGGCEGSVFV